MAAIAIGAAALPSSASAGVIGYCAEGAGFSVGVPLPAGLVPPESPVGEPDLSSGPSCSIHFSGLECAISCQTTVRASGSGLVAGRVAVSTLNSMFVEGCGPALDSCQTSITRQGVGFVRCSVSGVLAAFTAVSCEVTTP